MLCLAFHQLYETSFTRMGELAGWENATQVVKLASLGCQAHVTDATVKLGQIPQMDESGFHSGFQGAPYALCTPRTFCSWGRQWERLAYLSPSVMTSDFAVAYETGLLLPMGAARLGITRSIILRQRDRHRSSIGGDIRLVREETCVHIQNTFTGTI